MAKYYSKIDKKTKISTKSGTEIVLPDSFGNFSSLIICRCSYLQSNIQKIIYLTHGQELLAAKQTLTNFPNPKARMEFLSSFPYSEADPILSSVFNYSRKLFLEIYELRNVLAHENWMTSEDFKDAVLFSKLNEEARLSMASSRLLHWEETTPQNVYDGIIRYIRSVKVMSTSDLQNALKDADLCAWILTLIGNVLNQSDPAKKAEMLRAFLVYRGTSHLFDDSTSSSGKVNVKSRQSKTIRG